MTRPLVALLLALLVSPTARAVDFSGQDILVPIVGRIAGAAGTFWKTDLTISSVTTEARAATVSLHFTDANGTTTNQLRLSPGETAVLRDLLFLSFGREQAAGALRVTSDVPLVVRARIYTTHPAAGEFGQTVQGLPVETLGTANDLSGFILSSGVRLNAGIASPLGATVARLELRDRYGVNLAGFLDVAVPAGGVVQINDVLDKMRHLPPDGGSIHVTSTLPVYAYASVVRNDSGDAQFVMGTVTPRPDDSPLAPQCASPAPLSVSVNDKAEPGWLLQYREGADTVALTNAFAVKYNFIPEYVWPSIRGFYAEMSKEAVAGLRCETEVLRMEQNQRGEPLSH
jgi:hypothetical protein